MSRNSDFQNKALKFADDLRKSSEAKRVTYLQPITARKICEAYKRLYDWHLTSRQIRMFANWLRRQQVRIGSSTKGYWWIEGREGLEMTRRHFLSRCGERGPALRGVENSVRGEGQEDLFQ